MKRYTPSFTMVEVILVMVIIAVMAGIAMPRFGRAIARQRLDAAVRRVTVDLAYAQKRAIQSNAPQTVTFDEATGSYALNQTPDLNHASQTYRVDLSIEPYQATLKNVGFRASGEASGDPAIVFDIYGAPDSGGQLRLFVGDAIADLTLDAQTGRVTATFY